MFSILAIRVVCSMVFGYNPKFPKNEAVTKMQISFKSLPVKSRTLLKVNWASRENGYLIEREAFDSKSSDERSCVLNNESFLTQKQPGHYYLFRFKCL